MRSTILFLSIFVSLLFTISLVSAAFTVSVDVSKSLTENGQATVTVIVTNPSGTESNIVTTLSSSTSWFSVVTACSTISSLSAGQSSASTCIIKPTSTGSDLTLTASSESTAGTTGSGSASGINVAAQTSSLTASISADSSVATSATFYVGITVTAPSANDVVNARTTISESGQCTVDTSYVPATQSLGNITKGTTKSPTNWKLTSSSASGTCTVTVNVVSDVGGTASPSKSITVGSGSSSSSGSAATSAGGGGGGTATTAKTTTSTSGKEVKITIPSIVAKSHSTAVISSSELVLTAMNIEVVNTVSNVQFTVKKIDGAPASIVSPPSGVVNQYFDVSAVNISAGDVNKVMFDFNINKVWINSNNIDPNTVSLYRYRNDQWEKSNTSKTGEDSENISYQSISPGFSVFAVAGEKKIQDSEEKPVSVTTTQPQQEQIKEEKVSPITKSKTMLITAVVVIAVIIAVVVLYLVIKNR